MKVLTKFAGFAVAVTVVLGMKFYNKSAIAKEVKQSMLAVCATDNQCNQAVNDYFQDCFNSSYRMGSRRRAASLDNQKLAACVNQNANVEYFVVN